nr:EOG090X08OG [Cyclestheria hislopi]
MYNPSKLEDRYDPHFTAEISAKMQVPKRIRVAGNLDDDAPFTGSFVSRYGGNQEPKFDMKVPERILVVGQDQHVGMRAPPHELVLENSILPMENGHAVRVRTPPRTITVDTLPNGSEEDSLNPESMEDQGIKEQIVQTKVLLSDSPNDSLISEPPRLSMTPSQLTEEVVVLRQHISRLHRRMAGLEREQHQRQQRDALVVSIGVVYLVWKVILWLTRTP